MGGATVFQFLYEGYNQNLVQAITHYANALTAMTTIIWQGVVSIWILVVAKRLMFNQMTAGEGASKLANLAIIWLILTADNYATWVITPGSKTIPDLIQNALTGSTGLVGAQGYDALLNQIDNFCAQARSQTTSFLQIGDRTMIWIIGFSVKIFIGGCYGIWSLAMATADFLLPLGRIVLPFFLFDATRGFAERWYGKIFALFLVMIIATMLGQVVVYQDAQYMQRYAAFLGAKPADSTFTLNPMLSLGDGGIGAPLSADMNAADQTINVDGAIDTLTHIGIVTAFGVFLMVICTGIALFIGAAHGYSAAPAFNALASVVRFTVRR